LIQVQYDKAGRSCPVIACDVCGTVLKAGKGIYVYPSTGAEDTVPVHLLCKGDCDRAFQGKYGETRFGELPALLGFLAHNSGTTLKSIKENIITAESL